MIELDPRPGVRGDERDFMTSDSGSHKASDANQAQRLLEALVSQRAELGEIAAEIISLLEAAGISLPDEARERDTDSTPD